MFNRVVITGIGMITAVGGDRETSWKAVRAGRSGVRRMRGIRGLPDTTSMLGATVGSPFASGHLPQDGPMALQAAGEAMEDSQLTGIPIDRTRFGCALSVHMGDTPGYTSLRVQSALKAGEPASGEETPWWKRWLPNTVCSDVANHFHLDGPRLCSSSACASSAISTLQAVRAIQDDQCDIALTGGASTIHPLIASGFHNMRVLAQHEQPELACRPFDANRTGFVMGEGAAMLVVERLSHALARQAPIYAEIVGGRICCDAHHVTDLSEDSAALSWLISETLKTAKLSPSNIAYINAHGTGTLQNDVMETQGVRNSFGQAAEAVCMSSTKSVLGHLVNAAGVVELAISTLALRDGFAPPTVNLTQPDPKCDLDCVPLVGRRQEFEHVLKLSIAFGGHLTALVLRRWSDAGARASLLAPRHAA